MGAEYAQYAYGDSALLQHHSWLIPAVHRMLRACGPVQRLLDAGCGNGAFTRTLLDDSRAVYAFDLSDDGVTHARSILGAERVRSASLYDDFRALFDGVDSFDVIVSSETIEHLYSPATFVTRAREALRAGGSLILTTPYHGYLKNVVMAAAGKMDDHYSPLWDGGHIKFFSRATLTKLLENHGFRVVDFQGGGRLPYMWKSMILRAVAVG